MTSLSCALGATYAAGSGPVCGAVADLEGDGNTDSGGDQVSALYGDVGAGFPAQSLDPTAWVPVDMAVADLAGRGMQDIVLSSWGAQARLLGAASIVQTNSSGTQENTLQDTNPAASFVIFIDQVVLGRVPEQSGLQFWT